MSERYKDRYRGHENDRDHENNINYEKNRTGHSGRDHKKRKSGLRTGLVVTGVLALAALGSAGGLLAKYRSEQTKQAEMLAKDFHFSSNYLEEGKDAQGKPETVHIVSDWTDGITLELYNYEKENPALVSALAVGYEVSISGDQSGSFDISGGSGTLAADTSNEGTPAQVTIKPKAGANITAEELTVTVKTTPYDEGLCASFRLTGRQHPEIYVEDNGTHYTARVYANHSDGSVELNWTNGLIPDATNDLVQGWSNGSGSIDVDPFHTYEILFFKPSNGASGTITLG